MSLLARPEGWPSPANVLTFNDLTCSAPEALGPLRSVSRKRRGALQEGRGLALRWGRSHRGFSRPTIVFPEYCLERLDDDVGQLFTSPVDVNLCDLGQDVSAH